MITRKLATTAGVCCCLIISLGLFGCSGSTPLSPASPDASTSIQAAGTAAVGAAAREGEVMGGEEIQAAGVEFLGLIGQVSVENSTIQFWNQDDNFTVILGHVTANTVLLDGDGNLVAINDFFACFSANVAGEAVGDNEIELESVVMIPF